jgi:hypothetical protein
LKRNVAAFAQSLRLTSDRCHSGQTQPKPLSAKKDSAAWTNHITKQMQGLDFNSLLTMNPAQIAG